MKDVDVVRHRLVQRIIMAYDRYERERKHRTAERPADTRTTFRAARNKNNLKP